jgi:hypothetical protein
VVGDPVLDPVLGLRSNHSLPTTKDTVHAVSKRIRCVLRADTRRLTFGRTQPIGTMSARDSDGQRGLAKYVCIIKPLTRTSNALSRSFGSGRCGG